MKVNNDQELATSKRLKIRKGIKNLKVNIRIRKVSNYLKSSEKASVLPRSIYTVSQKNFPLCFALLYKVEKNFWDTV